jgi:hypothetical protein
MPASERSRNAAISCQVGVDPADLGLGDAAVRAERLDQVIGLASRVCRAGGPP